MKTLLLLLLFVAPQADPVLDSILKEGRSDNKVMEHLDHLTNKIGPRLTSSTNLTKACEWARGQFESWGLKARLEEWGTFPVGFDRGPWSAKMTEPEEKELTIGFNAWTAGTNGPVTGPAILAPANEEELKEAKDKLKGAWVMSTGRGPEKFAVAYEEAGIAGIVRSAGGELILTGGSSRVDWEKLPERVTVSMLASQHKGIVEQLKALRKVTLAIDIKNTFVPGPIKLYNVIAEIPGTEKPDEVVVFGGHIDSWDGATGATDNGTGVSTTLEAARLLAKAGAKPKRTIRFMLWSGEEQGLLGSRAWIKAHKEELPKISAVIVHDGGTNFVSGIQATEAIYPVFEKALAPLLALEGELKFQIKKVKGLPRGVGSDHDSFLASGVPGFFWSQSKTATKGQNYNHEHHTQHDLYAAAVPEFQKHTSIVVAIAAWQIANLDELLPRENLTVAPSAQGGGGGRRLLGVQTNEEMVIEEVTGGSAAEKAGLKTGDKILRIAGKDVADVEKLREEIKTAPKETKVVVRRDGKDLELPVTFQD
jgi:carboxypeptidase Q